MQGSRLGAAVVAAVVTVALALPGVASAGTLTPGGGGTLVFTAAPGEENGLLLTRQTLDLLCEGLPTPCLSITDNVPITAVPAACVRQSATDVVCPAPTTFVAGLGDMGDLILDWDGPSIIDGGTGNDQNLIGGGGDDVIRGGPGNDHLTGDAGDDVLEGGDGDDTMEGFGASLPTDIHTTGRDTYVGGPGRDLVDYEARSEPLTVTLDGVADDGMAGEGDNVGADVENVRAGLGADVLVGSAAVNQLDASGGDDVVRAGAGEDTVFGGAGDDRLAGDDGQDQIEGGDGGDEVDGGRGMDKLWGDEVQVCIPGACASGMDRILARDGEKDTVRCGPGQDSAVVDAVDDADQGVQQDLCEVVERPSTAPGGGSGAGGSGGGGSGGPGAGGPGTGTGAPSGTDTIRPRLTRLSVPRLRLRAGRTTVRYALSEAARVTFTVQRRTVRRGRVRWVQVPGSFTHRGRQGSNRLVFRGRLGRRRLGAGTYRLLAVARDGAGNRSLAARATLRVVR